MKKSFIRSSLLLLSALTLVACGGNADNPDSGSAGGGSTPAGAFDASAYEEEGKLFFYFTLTGDVTIPEYCGVYLTGGFTTADGATAWKTAVGEACTLTAIEGADNVYGGSYEVDPTTLDTLTQGYEYQLTLGYNAESGSTSTGVNWSFKSDECQAGSGDSGTENLSFTLNASGLSANLGNHTWSSVPNPVSVVENIDIQITFAEAVPEYISLFMPGDFRNNWSSSVTEDIMTTKDRKTFTMHVDEINLSTFNCQIIAEYSDATAFTWGTKILNDGTESGGDFKLGILKKYANSVYNLNEQFTTNNANFKLNDDGYIDADWAAAGLPERSSTMIDFTVELTFANVTKASTIYVSAGFNSWGKDEMTASDDKKVWTSKAYNTSAGSAIEFGLPLDDGWHVGIKASASDNFKVTLLETNCVVKVAVDADNCTSLDGFIDANDSTKWEVAIGTVAVEAVADAGGTTAAA